MFVYILEVFVYILKVFVYIFFSLFTFRVSRVTWSILIFFFFLKKGQFSEGGLQSRKNFFFQPLFLGVFLIV